MYSAHNEGKSAVAERFGRTSKNVIYKYMTSISKNVYIDKLDNIVNKYNDRYHSTIKIKPVDAKSNTYINPSKEMMKILHLKLVMLLACQNIKLLLQKAMFQIGLKKFLLLQKLKILFRGHILLVILKAKKLLQRFTKNNCKTQIKKTTMERLR